jgi:hypothetical protein
VAWQTDDVIVTASTCTSQEFARFTGWDPKPEGMCQGDVCVPAPGARASDGTIDIDIAARALGMPLVRDDETGIAALGPASLTGRALTTAVAPDPELHTFDGATFRLSSLRGRKVVLAAWASY